MHWLFDCLATPSIPVTTLVGVLILFGLFFGVSADPFSTILGFSSWIGVMYHLYTREKY